MNNQTFGGPENQAESVISFPGIDPELIVAAGIRGSVFPECHNLTGSSNPGILIPYFQINGTPVFDPGQHYCRLRLYRHENGKKYHQPSGTVVHSYITPGFAARCVPGGHIIVVEGEKKALALASEGWPALGMSGFYGCMNGGHCWTEEFLSCLQVAKPKIILFVGDQDTIFNGQFTDAATKLVSTFPDTEWESIELRALVVPPDAPGKGVDDCRAELGEAFRPWFENLVSAAVPVRPDTIKGDLAMALLEQHREAIVECIRDGRKKAVGEGLAKLAARIGDPLSADEIKSFAVELGFKANPFGQAVKAARINDSSTGMPEDIDEAKLIDLSEPVGEWTRQTLERVVRSTYVTSDGQLARLCGHYLEPFSAKSLPAFLDRPDVATFTKSRADDSRVIAKFGQKDAELVLGSVLQNRDFLHPVRFVSSIPVLVEKPGGGIDIVQSYDREREILVTSPPEPILPQKLHDAFNGLLGLLWDFSFPRWQDYAALLSLILSPALVRGGFLGAGRVPFFLVSKDQKGAGGSLLCRVICALYDHPPEAITFRKPDRAYEAVSSRLFKGASILYLDNLRGNLLTDLPFLESLLTEPIFAGRMLYRDGPIDVRHLVMMATSNGVRLSEDLADRAVEVQIRKQSQNYQFHPWPEGDLISHIAANQSHYRACIYSIIQHWEAAGKPGGYTSGLRFDRWEAAVTGILERYPGHPLQLFPDGARGRRRTMSRLSSPDFEEVEVLCRDLCVRGQAGNWLTASEIVKVTNPDTFWDQSELSQAARALGMMLKNHCTGDDDDHDVGEDFVIQHRKQVIAENNYKETNLYRVLRSDQFRQPA